MGCGVLEVVGASGISGGAPIPAQVAPPGSPS